MLKALAHFLIRRAEQHIGVAPDYAHQIAQADIGLLARYKRLFGSMDPNRHSPAAAYHTARLRGALSADCGTCVEAEINLAIKTGLPKDLIDRTLKRDAQALPPPRADVIALADAVTDKRTDAADAHQTLLDDYGQKGLIELSYTTTGAALLSKIKTGHGPCNTLRSKRSATDTRGRA